VNQHPPNGSPSPDPGRPRLEITSEDLAAPEVERHVAALREAAAPPLVRAVGAPAPAAGGAFWRRGLVAMAIAGLLGGLAGFALSELVMGGDDSTRFFADDVNLNTAMWMTLVALGLAALLSGWEGIETRNTQKLLAAWKIGMPVTAVAGFLGGIVAQLFYSSQFDRVFERALGARTDAEAFAIMESGLRIPRAIAFLVAGATVGIALGFASGASQRVINGAIGGAVGGFAGGLLFSFVSTSGGWARAVALSVTGLAVGGAIGLVEQARKEVWLEITNGGMAGKQFILYHETTTIGSAPGCHVTLIKDPYIAPHHVDIVRGPHGPEIRAVDQAAVVLVNGQPTQRAPVRAGDHLQVGTTILQFGLREQAMPTVAGMQPR
jgi:hypothetical protein